MTKKLDEKQRLKELESLNIMDTPPEEEFDAITRLAAKITGTPVAMVSLLDSDRQWFKSKVGIEASETPRDVSFCQYALGRDEPLVVTNPSEDERFKDGPLVKGDPQIGFYFGVPLNTSQGNTLGTLCLIDQQSHTLNDEQVESLKLLGKQVVLLLEHRKRSELLAEKSRLLEEKNVRIERQQKALVEKSKLASLGRMSTVLAHEINNPLTIVKGHASQLKKRKDDIDYRVDKILFSVDRMKSIIKGLKSYSRGESDELTEVSVDELVKEGFNLMEPLAKSLDIDLKLNINLKSSEKVKTKVSRTLVSQILMNLIQNAYDVVVEQSDSRWIEVSIEESEEDAIIAVMNSGERLDPSKSEVIFEPFYTTKEESRGSGLGLSLSKSFAARMGGTLELDPNPELKNTRFVLSVPKS